jgi:hypothetical protein
VDAQSAALVTDERFLRYLGGNIGLFVLWAFVWGIPAVAGLQEFTKDDPPPVLAALLLMLFALPFVSFFALLAIPPLLLYLSIVYLLPRRRLVAVLLSPLAIVVLFFVGEGVAGTAVLVLAGVSYGASVWFPHGPRAWWENRPRLIATAAAVWLGVLAAVGIVQTRSAGVRTDVALTIRDGPHTARYRLACDYDRAWRIRSAVESPDAHPAGEQACDVLDSVTRDGEDGPLQQGCSPGGRTGELRGMVRGRPFEDRIAIAPCEGDSFADRQAEVLVPPLSP